MEFFLCLIKIWFSVFAQNEHTQGNIHVLSNHKGGGGQKTPNLDYVIHGWSPGSAVR